MNLFKVQKNKYGKNKYPFTLYIKDQIHTEWTPIKHGQALDIQNIINLLIKYEYKEIK